MLTTTLTRPARTYTSSAHTGRRASRQPEQVLEDGDRAAHSSLHLRARLRRNKDARKKDPPPLMQKVGLAAQVYGIQGLMGTVLWFQGWREWLYPPGGGPNIVKAYEIRPALGVRIFFPASYDLTSPQTLPTVLTIHGGGFCIGTARDDDEWNRAFADSQNMLVISLPYSKAPAAPFPAALHDLEVLYLAVLADESLPISRASTTTTTTTSTTRPRGGGGQDKDKGQVAILGFNAGGNLALGLSQLPRIREQRGAKTMTTTPPSAVVSISGYLDLGRTAAQKLLNRPHRPALSPPPTNNNTNLNHNNNNNNNNNNNHNNHNSNNNAGGIGMTDALAATHEAYVWSYVPYGTDLQDPLLSPAFATWDDEDGEGALPAHVCLVGAELDLLAHESWRMACRLVRDGGARRGDGDGGQWGRWRVPDPDGDDVVQRICGRAGEEGKVDVPVAAGGTQGSEQVEMSVLPPARSKGDGQQREGEGRRQAGEGAEDDEADDGLTGAKRFGFEVRWRETAEGERGSVRWILVPDVLHGFDRTSWRTGGGGPELVRDAEEKTCAYVDAVGAWLRGTVWGV